MIPSNTPSNARRQSCLAAYPQTIIDIGYDLSRTCRPPRRARDPLPPHENRSPVTTARPRRSKSAIHRGLNNPIHKPNPRMRQEGLNLSGRVKRMSGLSGNGLLCQSRLLAIAATIADSVSNLDGVDLIAVAGTGMRC